MRIDRQPHQALLSPPAVRTLVLWFSLSAASIHAAVAPAHFEEGWTYGVFFLLVAAGQGLYAVGLLATRVRLYRSPGYLLAGITGSFMLLVLYLMSRLVDIPAFGSHLSHAHVEPFGVVDVTSKILEAGIAALLVWLVFQSKGSKEAFGVLGKSVGLGIFLAVALVALARFQVEDEDGLPRLLERLTSQSTPVSDVINATAPSTPQGSPPPALPPAKELLPLLTRSGNGPPPTTVDLVYAPPLFFQLAGEEAPPGSRARPTAVFFLLEADHDHLAGVGPQVPPAFLRLDGGKPVEPYEVAVLSQDPYHRTSRLLFPLPPEVDPARLDQEKHTLTILISVGALGEAAFTWGLPVLSSPDASSPPPAQPPPVVAGASKASTRTARKTSYGGVEGIELQATYLAPERLLKAFPQLARPDQLPASPAFVVTETSHGAVLPRRPPELALRVDGRRHEPQAVRELTTSSHHRVAVYQFPPEATIGRGHHAVDLDLPDKQRLQWHFPLPASAGATGATLRLTWASGLALIGGVLAAMWPCLFQLTAYFIPSLAGVSMAEARASRGLLPRWQVLRAALLFVAGFTVVYTAAGALIGFGSQALSGTSFFYTVQRPVSLAAGVVMLALAARVAARARAPLVCKMPVLSRMAQKRGAGPWEMMVAGIAFASGCMTCFGSAVVIGMVVYTGLSGSPLFGAFILFLFSLGMALPLVIGALAMARALPLLFRIEKVVPWMGLASALIMVAFASLLLSGNYMALSAWVYRLISF